MVSSEPYVSVPGTGSALELSGTEVSTLFSLELFYVVVVVSSGDVVVSS